MAKNQNPVLDYRTLKEDAEVIAAIGGMSKYAPSRPGFGLEELTAADDALTTKTQDFVQKDGIMKAARDAMVAAQWARHNVVLGAKQQVIAQFGDDSDEAQSIGLIKKSEYKSRRRKAATTATAPAAAQS